MVKQNTLAGDLPDKSLTVISRGDMIHESKTNVKRPPKWARYVVSHVDITWNSFLPYLINLADKLEGLGFRYVDNEVTAPKEVTDEK